MGFNFVMYSPHQPKVKETEPKIEVHKSGRIRFNQIARENFLKENLPYCLLGYDKEKNTIGMMLTKEASANAFILRYVAKGAYVGAKKFLMHFSILPEEPITTKPIVWQNYISIPLSE